MSSQGGGGTVSLRPRARLVRALGDELISSESVAVTELVKNAYDADATDVLLRFFEPLERGMGSIELLDNGHGMSPETLSTAFLEPATPFRLTANRTRKHRRRVLGEKGIGRFAMARLADRLRVSTREPGAEVESTLSLAWEDFDDEDKYLDEIQIRWDVSAATELAREGTFDGLLSKAERPRRSENYHGTILRMEGLRRDWEESDFQALRNRLSRLVSPFESGIGETFRIHLAFPGDHAALSGTVTPPGFLSNPHYHVEGRVGSDGTFDLEATLKQKEGRQPVSGKVPRPDGKPLSCGPFEIELRVWDRDPDSLAPLVERHGGTLRSLRQELNAFAGVSIYRDGFRVLPYGEPQNDWLRLDLRRVQAPARRLSNNQIVGYIAISADANPELKDQSNREGLLQNEGLADLETAVLAILSQIEARRYEVRRQERDDDAARGRGLFSGLDLADLQDAVRRHAPDDKELQGMVAESARTIRAKVDDIQEVLARYHRLATLGQLVDTILHDGRAPLAKVQADVTLALKALGGRAAGRVPSGTVRKRLEGIGKQAEALDRLFKKIEPFGGRRRGRPRRVLVENVVRDAVALLESEIDRHSVTVKLPRTETEVRVDPPELQSVIYNLVGNSVYWLATLPQGSERIIRVQVRRTPTRDVQITVEDSGPGVDPELSDRIFEPYFSTKPRGTGLGLTHAGEIVTDYYDGRLELLEPGPLGGARFRATLRYRV